MTAEELIWRVKGVTHWTGWQDLYVWDMGELEYLPLPQAAARCTVKYEWYNVQVPCGFLGTPVGNGHILCGRHARRFGPSGTTTPP
jgi:hypothetical protein